MAGPWFAVYESGDDWTYMGDVWISNGQTDERGKFYVRATLTAHPDEHYARLSPD